MVYIRLAWTVHVAMALAVLVTTLLWSVARASTQPRAMRACVGKGDAVGEYGGHIAAVVISMDEDRYNATRAGIPFANVSRVVPWKADRRDESAKRMSNFGTWTDVLAEFASDHDAPDSQWRMFFEDDATPHAGANVESAIRSAMYLARHDGLLYMGMCGARCASCEDDAPHRFKRCVGLCTCAFACTKLEAARLTRDMELMADLVPDQDYRSHFDVVMMQRGPAWLVGADMVSDQVADHTGLFYQDRKRFPSNFAG